MTDEFWKRKSLAEMSRQEWESLCDGCALCCVQKLEGEETGAVYFTDIACRLLDVNACRCTDYAKRAKLVADCLVLSANEPEAFAWLPGSCAYKLLAAGQDLPDWHHLVSGDPASVHEAGISAMDTSVSEHDPGQYSVLRRLS